MSEFSFRELDEEGLETLEAISKANRFNQWMFDRINPYCKGKILEIGSGIGNISKYHVAAGNDICLTDIRDNYIQFLENKFIDSPADIFKLDIVHEDFDTKFSSHLESYDTVFALNVVEHIKNHELAIQNIHKILKKGGHIIILVPAYQALYNSLDVALEHYRRYTSGSLSKLINSQGFELIKTNYFNAAGMAGWWFTGNILKKKTIPSGQMKIYNSLVPAFKILDKVVLNKVGLSTICVARKI